MFIFPAGKSCISLIPFLNFSRNINILSRSQNFPIRTQIAFYEKFATIPVQQVHFNICIFILIICRIVVIFPRHRMVSKSYLFSGGASRLSNIYLTCNSGPRSGLARFVLERAQRTAQNVPKELSG